MTKLLSLELGRVGFKSVLNRIERVGTQARMVNAGVPYTFDSGNGVMVVYDERGKPWVGRETQLHQDADQHLFGTPDPKHWEFEGIQLRRGAYVPFATDGGAWACENLPRIAA